MNLRVRRPTGANADPQAGPGGVDYRSEPLPNEHLDCEKVAWLFRGLDLTTLRACVLGIQEPVTVIYRLRRQAQPELALREEDATPECLKRLLPRIPVPREIVYQSTAPEKGKLLCYSSRINVEADELLGVKVPTNRVDVQLDFPLLKAREPKNDDEMQRLLASWSLTPFWRLDDKSATLPARIVTDSICTRCIGEKEMLEGRGEDRQTWP